MKTKITPDEDGFHHFVFVGLRATAPSALAASIDHLQAGLTAVVETSADVKSCQFFGNHARFEDDVHFGLHVIFKDEAGLDAVRQRPDHRVLMEWFEQVTNGRRTEVNMQVSSGQRQGCDRAPGKGLIGCPEDQRRPAS